MSTETYVYDTRIFIPRDDSLEYKVSVSKAVPRGDARLSASVRLLVGSQDNSAELIEKRTLVALEKFVPVNWEIQGQKRNEVSPGYELVVVKVVARISEKQRHNLDERARGIACEGLEITDIQVSAHMPQELARNVIKDLWFEIVERVNEHIVEFNRVSGRQWRIGDIVYGVPSGDRDAQIYSLIKGGQIEKPDDLTGLCYADNISLTAQVTLKSPRPGRNDE